jgi:NAD(P)-dependent dehydrogenase (short-subunit alcohol dehydrogenase family)
MGRSIALTLARDGADVAVNYRRDAAGAEAVVRAIAGFGRKSAAFAADIGAPEEVERMAASVTAELGPIDVVVNSAGAPWKPLDVPDIPPEHIRRVLDMEISATYALLRVALPGMRSRGWGRFISISGHLADEWPFGPPDAPLDYPLGKAARNWLTRTLAPREFDRGITINAVAPGPTRPFSLEEAVEAARSGAPASRENTPQHIADVVAFLCSDAAARVTGAVIPVPGARPV